jgi:hypothetical protein
MYPRPGDHRRSVLLAVIFAAALMLVAASTGPGLVPPGL